MYNEFNEYLDKHFAFPSLLKSKLYFDYHDFTLNMIFLKVQIAQIPVYEIGKILITLRI